MYIPRRFYEGEFYHICNKSISNYNILKSSRNASRLLQTIQYYNDTTVVKSFSRFLRDQRFIDKNYEYPLDIFQANAQAQVKILTYCIMPDHYHLLVKLLSGNLSAYINRFENSYSHFFNILAHRKGPLWQSRFRSVLIDSNELLLHSSRYQHLNPTTAGLVKKPEDWEFSSYRDFVFGDALSRLPEISMQNPELYRKFCEDQIDYQKTLRKIKHLLLE